MPTPRRRPRGPQPVVPGRGGGTPALDGHLDGLSAHIPSDDHQSGPLTAEWAWQRAGAPPKPHRVLSVPCTSSVTPEASSRQAAPRALLLWASSHGWVPGGAGVRAWEGWTEVPGASAGSCHSDLAHPETPVMGSLTPQARDRGLEAWTLWEPLKGHQLGRNVGRKLAGQGHRVGERRWAARL